MNKLTQKRKQKSMQSSTKRLQTHHHLHCFAHLLCRTCDWRHRLTTLILGSEQCIYTNCSCGGCRGARDASFLEVLLPVAAEFGLWKAALQLGSILVAVNRILTGVTFGGKTRRWALKSKYVYACRLEATGHACMLNVKINEFVDSLFPVCVWGNKNFWVLSKLYNFSVGITCHKF